MGTTPFDWAEFEAALYEELRWSIAKLGRQHRAETFYVVALYGIDRELDGLLSLPLVAANTTSSSAASAGGDFWAPRWNPADWEHDELAMRKQGPLRLEKALIREATSGTQRHWRATEKRYFSVLLRVARRLRDAAPELLPVSDDFVTFVQDDDGGAALARKTIPKRRYEALFAKTVAEDRERRQTAGLAVDERCAFLVTRFACYEGVTSEDAQRELLAVGADAVPYLVPVVADAKTGWLAAKLLGSIGVATDEVLTALRAQADGNLWHPMALGMLRDYGWLTTVPPIGTAILGLVGPLKAITSGARALPLDYHPLEGYLDRVGKPAIERAEPELAPGSSYVDISPADVTEALRGLHSKYAVVRWHAASILGDRRLGKANGKRILPELAACLKDRNRLVRRLAILAMARWKAASKPYRDVVAAVASDSDPTVRRTAATLLGRKS